MELSYKDRFIRSKERNLAKNTLDGYENDISTFLNRIIKKNGCSEVEAIEMITPEFVEDYIYEKGKEEYSKSSLNRQLASLTSFYTYLEKTLHKVALNPFKGIERFDSTDPQQRESLSLEETKAIIKETYINKGERMYKLSSSRTRFIISLMTTTGMRIEEILSLSKTFIEEVGEDYIVVIPKELSKNDQPRRVPICGLTKVYYHEYLKERNNLEVESDLLILSNNKKKFDKKNSRDAIHKYVKRIGVEKNIGNHSFRHTFRTVATMQNVNEGIICCIGGWSRKSLGNQSDIYLHDTSELDMTKINICKSIL